MRLKENMKIWEVIFVVLYLSMFKGLVAENRNNKEKLKIIYKIFNHSNYSLGHANDTI